MDKEKQLILKIRRNMGGRYRTYVRRTTRDNKNRPEWMQEAIKSPAQWMKDRQFEDTYFHKGKGGKGIIARQLLVDAVLEQINTSEDVKAFYDHLGAWLTRWTEKDGYKVTVYHSISYSSFRPEQDSIRFGIKPLR